MKGHIGLIKIMEAYPGKTWYGILGDDNYVHWPSLLAGLTEVTAKNKNLVELAVSETRCGTTRLCGDGKPNRIYGGAGVFFNRQMALKLKPKLLRLAKLCERNPLARQTCGRDTPHDEHVGVIILSLGSPLVQGDFLLSQPPCFYVTRKATGCPAGLWLSTPPAVLHYITPVEMLYYFELASLAANITLEASQLSLPYIPPAPEDDPSAAFITPRGFRSHFPMSLLFPGRKRNLLGGSNSSSSTHLNCIPSAGCTAQLLTLGWSRLLNRPAA
jgi:hypothetical protein